jgi:sugar phosphate permease
MTTPAGKDGKVNPVILAAAATAGGFCGLFGYGSTIVSGWGMGMLVQYTDWSVALYTLVGMALVGTAVFAAAWKAKPNGYDD